MTATQQLHQDTACGKHGLVFSSCLGQHAWVKIKKLYPTVHSCDMVSDMMPCTYACPGISMPLPACRKEGIATTVRIEPVVLVKT